MFADVLQTIFEFLLFHRVVFDAHFVARFIHIEIVYANFKVGSALLVCIVVWLVNYLILSFSLSLFCVFKFVFDYYEVTICR